MPAGTAPLCQGQTLPNDQGTPNSFPSAVTPSLSAPSAPQGRSQSVIKSPGVTRGSGATHHVPTQIRALRRVQIATTPRWCQDGRTFLPLQAPLPGRPRRVLADGRSPGQRVLPPPAPGKPCCRVPPRLFPEPRAADENRDALLGTGCLGKCFSSKFHDRFKFFWRED